MPDLRPFSDVSWTEALSRLHPLVLHLPIAILIVLLLVELPRLFHKTPTVHDSTRSMLVALLILTAPMTAASGYFLGHAESYGPPVDWHQRLGIATAVVSVLAGLAYWRRSEHYPLLVLLGAGLVLVTGHLGATLTHGADFLLEPWLVEKSHARRVDAIETPSSDSDPTDTESDAPSEPASETPPSNEGQALETDLDSPKESVTPADEPQAEGLAPVALATPAFTFERDVLPIFEDFCFKCHSEAKQKGELRLDSFDFLLAGSEYGSVFIPGNAFESRLVEMLRLDLLEDEHMPPENKPQPEEEDIVAIETWIDSLASGPR
jgi:uncharacterized membrane protein